MAINVRSEKLHELIDTGAYDAAAGDVFGLLRDRDGAAFGVGAFGDRDDREAHAARARRAAAGG